eukprot:224509-Amphidinium_carterae.1
MLQGFRGQPDYETPTETDSITIANRYLEARLEPLDTLPCQGNEEVVANLCYHDEEAGAQANLQVDSWHHCGVGLGYPWFQWIRSHS